MPIARSRSLEQHIAVFGESGSGKTVLLSSFYGATQEPHYLQRSLYNIVADDIGQGSRLHRNYLGMRDSGRPPEATRFAGIPYSFSIKLKDEADPKAMKRRPFDALRLIWHDYPGEWFDQDVSGPEEAERRMDTFRSLLSSDVAFLLVDGQRLLDNAGEEERYLKSLFGNLRNSLLTLREGLLVKGNPLVDFPRIWIVALSKADLLPNMTVWQFRDLLIEKACDEMQELRQVIGGLIASSEALSVGEDYLLLSSARFEPGRIDVTNRIGLELILPIAAMLPFERHARWSKAIQLPGKVAESLLGAAGALLATALVGRKIAKPAAVGPAKLIAAAIAGADVLNTAVNLAGDKLKAINAEAIAKHDTLRATLTQFKLALEHGENRQVLLRSLR